VVSRARGLSELMMMMHDDGWSDASQMRKRPQDAEALELLTTPEMDTIIRYDMFMLACYSYI
jgi:hypothetical protein